ncbi:hypothetical protein FAIPA1_260076 [Frankia sp. AiPs1]|uniref:hypothetical protein n=1 Tax=Frankia sp. AiPa1 TaxID=573492 RepID=UPI00202B040B|nr:hypothetical protein [Frankia sp. AiPa1]MCL9762099.1 hypothetical protein [Frankia sp. AiPa1]
MTAGQMIAVLDDVDFARFDDDGGAPIRLRVAPVGRPETLPPEAAGGVGEGDVVARPASSR